MELAAKIVLALCAVAIIGKPLLNLIEDRILNRDDGHARRRAGLADECRAAGLSPADADDMLYLREAMARLRREASDAVREDPVMWFDKLEGARSAANDRVREHRRDLLPVFLAMHRGLTYGHVLYAEETALVDSQACGHVLQQPTQDQWAALRTVKPN